MNDPRTISNDDRPPSRFIDRAIEIALIALVFFLQSGWQVPHLNEPHYLFKANHYWNDSGCGADFFLASNHAHHVFYWTFGWLTNFFSLPVVGWIGRILTWGLLAWAWRRLSWALFPKSGYALLSAAIWVALLANFHLSGEWVIGGVEAKGFAYVLVLLGLTALVEGRWKRVWPLLGAAAAFHVIVGGWSVVAAGLAWCLSRRDAPRFREMLPALAWGFTLSLAGLVPALLLNRNVPSDIVSQGNQIYVFIRLKHHLAIHTLDPAEIVPRAVANAAMLATFFALLRFVPWSPSRRRLRGFVVGTMVIALGGLAISLLLPNHRAWAAGLLRFYWFRLYDCALPLGTALFCCAAVERLLDRRRIAGQLAIGLILLGLTWHFLPTIAANRNRASAPANRHTQPEHDWIEACRWVRDNTPRDALFMTPRMSSTFKWYAERAEVVTQKDIPQDAVGLCEWWDRMDRVHRFRHRTESGDFERRFRKTLAHQGERMLRNLGKKYGAKYMITRASKRLNFKLIHRNDSFAVYRIDSAEINSQSP